MSRLWIGDDLVAATGGEMRTPFDADGISIDTRSMAPGDLFVALKGDAGDGHDHVAAALRAGAAGVMVHRIPAGLDDTRLLVVHDTFEALRALGISGRCRFQGRMLAVTGSVGKTTTKEMLRRILSSVAETSAALASLNNHWGVPLTLARLNPYARFAVAEIGMNHAGEILPLARMVRPHVTVITAVAAAHIGYLGSIEAIADEKASISMALEPGGVAILPGDSPHFARLKTMAPRYRQFGTRAGMDARLISVDGDANGSTLSIAFDGSLYRTHIAAPGRHMAMNATAAFLAATAMGVMPDQAAAALEGFSPVSGRGARRTVHVADGTALLLDESYNASSVAVRAALAVLGLQAAKRRVVVLGDMRELGEAGPAEHRGLAPDIADVADVVYACGPLMKLAYDAIPQRLRGMHADTSDALAPIVAAALRDGDAVLVKGSLGSRMKVIVDAIEAIAADGKRVNN